MGKTSAASKNKYNEKAYDRISTVVPKGRKAELQAHAESRKESLNAFVNRAITETLARDKQA
jgi:predicted HicB family RNase H-like nuclease